VQNSELQGMEEKSEIVFLKYAFSFNNVYGILTVFPVLLKCSKKKKINKGGSILVRKNGQ
jgi:hypothetical protein